MHLEHETRAQGLIGGEPGLVHVIVAMRVVVSPDVYQVGVPAGDGIWIARSGEDAEDVVYPRGARSWEAGCYDDEWAREGVGDWGV